MENMVKQRDPFWDVIKGIAVILMLFGHSIEYGMGAEYFESKAYMENPYKIRSITTQSHGKKSSSYFGASPPKNAKNLIKIARARPAAASLFGALPPRRGQKGQKGAQRPSVSEHMRPFF